MSLLDDVSIVVTPNGYKAGELYAVVPVPTEGAEEVVNGDFATETVWTFTNVDFSVGAVLFDNANDNVFQSFSDTVNTLYKLTITKTGSGTLRFRSGFAGSAATKIEIPESGIIYFTSTSDTNRIQIYGDENSIDATLNSVSVKEYTAADMDVTRATAATRVDEDGLVNYAEIIGGEEIEDGDFPSGTTAWIFGAGWSLGTNKAERLVAASSTDIVQASVFPNLTSTFKISFDVVRSAGSVRLRAGTYSLPYVGATDTYIYYVTPVSNNQLKFQADSSFVGSISNVSVKEVTRDNVPRIDYTGGGCPHILAEPQRTNTVIYSEDFSQYNQSGTTPTLTTGQLAPDGTLGATKISGTIGSSAMWLADNSSTTATRSIYARTVSGTGTATLMSYYLNTNNLFTITEEWQRFELTGTTTGAGGTHFYIDFRDSSQTLSEFIVWGGQSEEATYATSYIPTSGSTVTRNQDIFTRDGIGSLINSTEGVLFVEMQRSEEENSYRLLGLDNGTSQNYIKMGFGDISGNFWIRAVVNGVTVINSDNAVSNNANQFYKIAVRYKSGDSVIYIDGVPVLTSSTTFSSGTFTDLDFTHYTGSLNFYGKVKQLQVYNTALTDEQLTSLTS